MALDNLRYTGLDSGKQQMVQSTINRLAENPFLGAMFEFVNQQGTPIQMGGGTSEGQAAGTFFNNNGSVKNIALGQTSFGSPDRFAGDLFNEIYSAVAIPGNVNKGKGNIDSFITQQQEFASFFGDGFAQEIAKGNNDPTAKEALANLDQFYGRSTSDVIKDPDGYGSLPKGSALSSALAWMGEKGFLPKDFVKEAQSMIDKALGGGGSEGKAAKDTQKKLQDQGNNVSASKPAPKMNDAKKQQLLKTIDKDVQKVASEVKEKTGKEAKTIEKEHEQKTEKTANTQDKQDNKADKKSGPTERSTTSTPPITDKKTTPIKSATPPEKPQEKK